MRGFVRGCEGRARTNNGNSFCGVNNGGRTDDNENNGAAGCVIKKRR